MAKRHEEQATATLENPPATAQETLQTNGNAAPQGNAAPTGGDAQDAQENAPETAEVPVEDVAADLGDPSQDHLLSPERKLELQGRLMTHVRTGMGERTEKARDFQTETFRLQASWGGGIMRWAFLHPDNDCGTREQPKKAAAADKFTLACTLDSKNPIDSGKIRACIRCYYIRLEANKLGVGPAVNRCASESEARKVLNEEKGIKPKKARVLKAIDRAKSAVNNLERLEDLKELSALIREKMSALEEAAEKRAARRAAKAEKK